MAIARVQRKKAQNSSGATLAVTMDSTPTAGNLLLAVFVTLDGTPTPPPTYTQAASGIVCTNVTWNRRISKILNNDSEGVPIQVGCIDLWEGTVGASPGAIVTATKSQSGDHAILSVYEYSGQHASSPFDVSASINDDSSDFSIGNPQTGTTAATSENDELAFGGAAVTTGSVVDPTSDIGPAGEATQVEVENISTDTLKLIIYEGLAEAIGAKNGESTLNSSPTNWGYAGVIATYKVAAAASATPTRNLMGVGL